MVVQIPNTYVHKCVHMYKCYIYVRTYVHVPLYAYDEDTYVRTYYILYYCMGVHACIQLSQKYLFELKYCIYVNLQSQFLIARSC